MAGLLRGVKVIESAMLMTGDFLGQLLADEGADVVKLEAPDRGDYLRDFLGQIAPHKRGHSPAHLTLNRNKRSVTVNLKTEAGREIFWHMLRETDVFVDGNTPQAMAKLGVGYEHQRRVKPDIIYAHVTGLGASGPYADVPTHGVSMNALAGAEPCEIDAEGWAVRTSKGELRGAASGVVVGPLYAAYGVAAALYRRATTQRGTYLDIACSDAIVAQCWHSSVALLNRERIQADESGVAGSRVGTPDASKYNYYETKDGKFLIAGLIEKQFWENFCRAIGREDLLAEGVGYENAKAPIDWGPPALRGELRKIFAARTLAEWMQLAVARDFVIAPVNSVDDLRTDPHLSERQAIVRQDHPTAGEVWMSGHPIRVPGNTYEIYRHAPAHGEHTSDYLRGLGYSDAQLDKWRDDGVI